MASLEDAKIKPQYRLAQDREFFKYIPQDHYTSPYAPLDQASYNAYVARPSQDSALTSFAQLGAIRLGAQRSLISLFDRTHQYVVAEATPSLNLISGYTRNTSEKLRFGCCIFPKERGICHHVSKLSPKANMEKDELVENRVLISLDLTQDERFTSSKLLPALGTVRYYVTVPIVSPRGFIFGAFCVMDNEPRLSGPDRHSIHFMLEMASTIMNHLVEKRSAFKSQHAERMIAGLGSFVEGRATLRDAWQDAETQSVASDEGQLNSQQQDLQKAATSTEKNQRSLPFRTSSDKSKDSTNSNHSTSKEGKSQNRNSVRSVLADESLQDNTLLENVKLTFSRAANLLRESLGVEGVVFLDANSGRFGSLVNQKKRRVSGPQQKDFMSSGDDSSESGSSPGREIAVGQSNGTEGNPMSEYLGFSTSTMSSINNDQSTASETLGIPETFLNSLLQRYPSGKIFTYAADGSVSEDSEQSTIKLGQEHRPVPSGPNYDERRPGSRKHTSTRYRQDSECLIKIFPGARSILLLPIWDSDRRRWFAGTLAWTNDPRHIFSREDELTYIAAFTNSIMAEIRRLDVELADKAKTNLVNSITHELRNPLHGILGTADILSDTAMNALQHGMVHTIESCGRTLLDTINSLLDLTFIDKYRKLRSHMGGKGEKPSSLPSKYAEGGRVQSKDSSEETSHSHVKLDGILEEVAECVFAGHSFYSSPQALPPALNNSLSRWAGPAATTDQVGPRASQASQVTIIFDIQSDSEWNFYTHAGAWRRILMNVFGNALKYTSSGYIYLGLKSSECKPTSDQDGQEEQYEVTLTVKDTGKGIGADYLQNDLFTPFKQEDSLASGSGLGLSIVRQEVGFLGGTIEIESAVGQGTRVSIRVPLTRSLDSVDGSSSSSAFSSRQKYTQGKTIGILGFGESLSSERDRSLYSSLERLCRDWFGLEVTNVASPTSEQLAFDFYLAVQTELDSENTEGRDLFHLIPRLNNHEGCSAPVVVICQSPEEAHRLFISAKNECETSLFEFVSQPCGPRKMARALELCLQRQLDLQSGQPSADEPTRWVEMPESSRLPVDIDPSDAPEERMKLSKRPTKETMGGSEQESQSQLHEKKGKTEAKNAVESVSPLTEVKTEPEVSRQHVLLVDDNDLNLQLLCTYAKKENYQYMTAKNGAEAVELFKTHFGKFRLILMDISMPVMDGFEASRQIRRTEKQLRSEMSEPKQLPPVVIAALTGLDSPNAQKEAFGSGIDTFLVKPVKRSDFKNVLKQTQEE